MKTPKSLNKSNQNFEKRGFKQTPKARNMKSKTPNTLPQKKSQNFVKKQNNSPNNKFQKNNSFQKNVSFQKKSFQNGNKQSENTPKKYNKRAQQDEESDIDSLIDSEAEEMESEEMASDDLDLNDLASDDEKDIKINKTISKNLSKRGQLPKIVDKDSNNDNSEDDFDLDDDEDDFENEDEESDIDLENSDEDVDEIDDDEEVVKVQPIKDNKKGTTLTPQKLNTKLAKEQPNNATNKRKQEDITSVIPKKEDMSKKQKPNENKKKTEIDNKDTAKQNEKDKKKKKKKNKNKKTTPAKVTETSLLPEDVLAMVMERITEKNKKTLYVKGFDIRDNVSTEDFMKLHPDISHVQFNRRQKRAFLEFGTEKICEKAIKGLKNKKLGTKDVTFDYCGDKSERNVPLDKPYHSRPYDSKTLYVTGFGKDTTKEILKKVFANSSSIKLLKFDKGKGSFKFAFICYPNPEDAEKDFRECHNKIVDGMPAYVTYALTKPKIDLQHEKNEGLTKKQDLETNDNTKKIEKLTNKNSDKNSPKNKIDNKKSEKKLKLNQEDAASIDDSEEETEDFDDEVLSKSDDEKDDLEDEDDMDDDDEGDMDDDDEDDFDDEEDE